MRKRVSYQLSGNLQACMVLWVSFRIIYESAGTLVFVWACQINKWIRSFQPRCQQETNMRLLGLSGYEDSETNGLVKLLRWHKTSNECPQAELMSLGGSPSRAATMWHHNWPKKINQSTTVIPAPKTPIRSNMIQLDWCDLLTKQQRGKPRYKF